jgi:hypothetical protein
MGASSFVMPAACETVAAQLNSGLHAVDQLDSPRSRPGRRGLLLSDGVRDESAKLISRDQCPAGDADRLKGPRTDQCVEARLSDTDHATGIVNPVSQALRLGVGCGGFLHVRDAPWERPRTCAPSVFQSRFLKFLGVRKVEVYCERLVCPVYP